VTLFCAIEIAMLRVWLAPESLGFLFGLLGVMVSVAALYGHIAISFLSRLIVNAVAPLEEGLSDHPRLGPAEALERQGDYDGALQEYLVLARIYPQSAIVHLRAAQNLVRLGRTIEAVPCFERTLHLTRAPEDALPVLYQLCELYEGDLRVPASAHRARTEFLDRFPESREADLVRERQGQASGLPIPEVAPVLEALEAEPLQDAVREEVGTAFESALTLEPLETTREGAVEPADESDAEVPEAGEPRQQWGIESLDTAASAPELIEDHPEPTSSLSLDPMDEPPAPGQKRPRSPRR
ncbi:MAG: hypothetical protein IT368_12475, partial [Candidatus Hydrogenedentes bacterium]|nr:hypothetical protein [Candidatus Hydrogenedentota bacterium]